MKHPQRKKPRSTQCALLRAILTSPPAQQMAKAARKAAARRDVLYHGTRYAQAVLKTMELRHSRIGDQAVFFSRSPEVAAYWATLARDDDEGRGAILILDRRSLSCRYRFKPRHDSVWCDNPRKDEMEEAIWVRDVPDLWRHLLGVVHESTRHREKAPAPTQPRRPRASRRDGNIT